MADIVERVLRQLSGRDADERARLEARINKWYDMPPTHEMQTLLNAMELAASAERYRILELLRSDEARDIIAYAISGDTNELWIFHEDADVAISALIDLIARHQA